VARLNRYFRIPERGSTIRTEVLGGFTTFATMAYIIVVNPAILSVAGLPIGPSTVATIIVAAAGSVFMGVYANRPLAVAPYMGENAFIAFGLTAMGIGWQLRLGAVFISGVLFLLITLLHVRSWLATAISPSLKHSFAAGIGLFLAFIGLYESGIVASFAEGLPLPPGASTMPRPDVPVKLGDLRNLPVQLAIGGLMLTMNLMCRGVRGAILFGMVATGAAGYCFGLVDRPRALVANPFTAENDLGAIAFQLDVSGALQVSFLPILLTLFLLSFLDTLGTLVGVGAVGGMLDEKGNLPEIEKPMLVDAAACVFSSLIGSSTSGAFIESAAGVKDGARSGLAAVVTGLLFALSLVFLPVVAPLQSLKFVYGPALVAVGIVMVGAIRRIDFDDLTELAPAFLTIMLIAFTYNIGNGLTAGLILHPILKAISGRWREVNAGSVTLALLSMCYYCFGLPH
jgi:AGZA family xanthine/uracil permease-like MFS transporter